MLTLFAKYEGAGNDFILIDNREGGFTPDPQRIARLCDRHFGIGADGLMTLARSTEEDCTMRYFNADGSEGEMCGNGARCFALFAEHLGIGGEHKYFRATDGLHTAAIRRTKGLEGLVELSMCDVGQIRSGAGWWFLNTGVPHYVEFAEELGAVDVCGRGRTINFVRITDKGHISVRTYERGVEAETLACGTGATAAAIITNFVAQPDTTHYEISVPGGVLSVRFSREPHTEHYTNIRLTGPARRVFEGRFRTENF